MDGLTFFGIVLMVSAVTWLWYLVKTAPYLDEDLPVEPEIESFLKEQWETGGKPGPHYDWKVDGE